MPNALATIRKNGVYTILTPDESFLIGHVEGHPAAFYFSQRKRAAAYREAIGKADHLIVKEDALDLTAELVELGVDDAFVDAENPKALPDPLDLKKYLAHLEEEAKKPASV